jgi:hypothetical protein
MPARISKTSPLTGRYRTLQISVYEQDEFDSRLLAWRRGDILLEDAFPNLSPSALYFIQTGITEDEVQSQVG